MINMTPPLKQDHIYASIPSHNHGGYGETVITLVCGTSITGSIPVGRPIENRTPRGVLFSIVLPMWMRIRGVR